MNFNKLQEEIYKTNSKEELEKYKYLTLDLIVKVNDKLLSMPNLELNFNPQSSTSYNSSKEMTQPKGTFGNTILYIDNKASHIVPAIQSLILTFYYDMETSKNFGTDLTHAYIISTNVRQGNDTQSGTFCPLIWRALGKCYEGIPQKHLKSYQENVDNFNAGRRKEEKKFDYYVDKLSKLKGWCKYARYILTTDDMNKDISNDPSDPKLFDKYQQIVKDPKLFDEDQQSKLIKQ